ncbi:MAG: UDP-N-acetylmuramoyl-tripeptide--D-alanyl-D-alanine ligase [Halieaceae bacterium]|jgi:UDP-N-acetylmuramoyl-tripeptide--D-alanyl-D-alanine ligase|nr:UDP-N-acetylmuramoyl-tripeptide--D-alanyl-D-alanine ligase [Halieaceae bacterium]
MMRPFSLAELETPLQAQLVGADREFIGVSTDSRQLHRGDLFVALRGEHFDGHDYLDQVAAAGAVAALVSEPADGALPQLRVADTLRALGRLGACNRALFKGPLVAITGSSGKTTVKNMVRAVLAQRGRTLATEGNLNNEIGVPLTLLALEPGVEFAVVEMGAARAGDIAWLCELGRPSVALLLNAMPAHLQGFGSVDDVAAAKGEIFDGLGEGDCAVINADMPWADDWRRRAGAAAVLDFGLTAPAAITAADVQSRGTAGVSFTAITPGGELRVNLALPGGHNVANALAAIAVGLACGLRLDEIGAGLETVQPTSGRLAAAVSPAGATVIDDCYNANPGSVRAAIDMLAGCEGRRTLVLGAMRELGPTSETLHRDIGAYARTAGLDRFWGVGPELQGAVDSFGAGGRWFADCETAIDAIGAEFGAADTVLVKGSRSTRMERVLHALLAAAPAGEG